MIDPSAKEFGVQLTDEVIYLKKGMELLKKIKIEFLKVQFCWECYIIKVGVALILWKSFSVKWLLHLKNIIRTRIYILK